MILSLVVLGRAILFLMYIMALLSILWHIFSVRCVILCKYSTLRIITLLYIYANCATVAFLFIVILTKSLMTFKILAILFFCFIDALIQTPRNLVSSFFFFAKTFALSEPILIHNSSLGSLEFITMSSDL